MTTDAQPPHRTAPAHNPHSTLEQWPSPPGTAKVRRQPTVFPALLDQSGTRRQPGAFATVPEATCREHLMATGSGRDDLLWRRLFGLPLVVTATFALLTVLTAVVAGLPLRDPDGFLGPSYLRLPLIVVAMIALDLLPRVLRQRPAPRHLLPSVVEAWQRRWSTSRLAVAAAGLASFYLAYVAYRNLKSYLPFLREHLLDPALMATDRWFAAGLYPADVLHQLLGTGLSAEILSAVYMAFLGFVPLSLTAALIWSDQLTRGAWYVTALCWNWILGILTYYAVPSLGPVYVRPSVFTDLPHTAVADLQNSLHANRLEALPDPHATEAMQGIAAFVSLHVSIVFTAALIAHRTGASRLVRIAMWTYLLLTAVATVYFGWHYLLDVPAGLAVGATSVCLAARATRASTAPVTAAPGIAPTPQPT
jgi:membrane-associated phospholipid phosphatase